MDFKNLLITGGAGFVGSNLALLFREARPDLGVTVLDSLKRRGSELNLPRLRAAGVEFRHGDIRSTDDFDDLPPYDLMIDCSAEPSVQAGLGGSPRAVLDTNLVGTINCLEAARTRGAAFLFLSTSRIYPIEALNDLPFTETDTRFRWDDVAGIPGFSGRGVAEGFTPRRGAIVLRDEQAGRRAIDPGVRLQLRHARADRPLRRHRRSLADGQGRPGRDHALGRPPLLRTPAALYWIRWPGQAGPRCPPRARPLRLAPDFSSRRRSGGTAGSTTLAAGTTCRSLSKS